jgi:hypothetical protein
MTFFYDLNKKLATLSAKQDLVESTQAVAERSTGDYSAKKARAGKDIGKPGKMFSKIAKSAGERYGSKERGEKVAGAVLAKLRAKKESVEQDGDVMDYLNDKLKDFDAQQSKTDESALQAYLGKKKYGEQGMKALQKAGREGASKETMARIRAKHDKMDEADMEEGNKFTGNLMKARAAGLKKADLDGDGDMETVREADVVGLGEKKKSKPDFLDLDKDGDKKETMKKAAADKKKSRSAGTAFDPEVAKSMYAHKDDSSRYDVKDTGYSKRYTRKPEPEADQDDEVASDAPKKKGRPAGTKRAIGAKGPTGRSKLMKKDAIKEMDSISLTDKGEYDQEGDMAKDQLHTLVKAAKELHGILADDDNLPEWVQSKITKALDYINSANDYMDQEKHDADNPIAEKAVSVAQRRAAGIAHAAQKGEIPKKELRGASKEMAKMPKGELKKFAKTKEKGLPEKVKEADAETPKEKKSSGGFQFGKGVYESLDHRFKQALTEGMNISVNMNTGPNGEPSKNITVSADGDDAEALAALLKMAGIGGHGDAESCDTCGKAPCGCEEELDENSPDWPTNTETSDNALQYSGGLNGPKSTGQTTIPVIASQLRRQVSMEESAELENNLFRLYQNYKAQ